MHLSGKAGGFDPGAICLRRGRRGVGTVLRRLAATVLVAGTMVVGPAGPASAASAHLTAVRAISAPSGAHGICQRYAWACSARAASELRREDWLSVATKVNRAINRQVREVSDQRQYRRPEVWALPTSRGGDCEDFALLKKRELIARGIPANRLLIATLLTGRGEAHAVLVLRTARGDMVLDNLTDRVRGWRATGYTFLRMQDPARPDRWTMVNVGMPIPRI